MISCRSIGALALTIVLSWSLPTLVRGFEATPPGKNAAAASAVLQSNFTSPDVTVTILKGKTKRLLLAHVYAETVGNTVEGTRLEIRVFANGVQMEPGDTTRPFHATKCTVGQIKPPPVLELDASCIASGTFWLDLDTVDPLLFIGQPIEVAVSTLAQRLEDSAFIRDGFVSVVAELVRK
jgi:hypothetical protein